MDVDSLESRIAQAVAIAGISARALSLRAGLSGGYLGTLLTRLRQRTGTTGEAPEVANVSGAVIEALAKAAGVSSRWLATGEGAVKEETLPTIAQSPSWPLALVQAQRRHPEIPASFFFQVGESPAWPGAEPDAELVADLARVTWEWSERQRRRALGNEVPDRAPSLPDRPSLPAPRRRQAG